ncbi:MAG: MAPEG family protein, partial [Albidovulum sp.]
APAIVILALKDGFGAGTLTAAQVFLVARVVYVPAYGFGLTGIRTALWIAGFAATVSLYLGALMSL